ncbi:MAG: YihY family inner membrane protein [Nitrospiraceae bacterium]|nr:YihY family inner membrane protein [Nitrospiraceae bacterium]
MVKLFTYIKDKVFIFFAVFWQSVKSFLKNDNSNIAASLAYHSLFAIIPLLLLLFFALSFFITSSRAVMSRITSLISEFIPYYSETILQEVYSLSKHQSIWGIISVLTLMWAATPLVSTLRKAFFDIFKIEERPSFLKTTLLDIGVILLTLTIFVLLSFTHVTFKSIHILGESTAFYNAASYTVTVMIISVFYLAFVPVKTSFLYVATGAIITTFFWGIIRPVFGLFLSYNPQYGIAFGSLKALFIIIIWIYYSFSVLLFGAEIIANLRRKDVLLIKKLFYEDYSSKTKSRLKNKFGKSYKSGDLIFKQGQKGDEMFYILSGGVRLTLPSKLQNNNENEQIIRIMKKNEYFGEMALLIGTPRTTNAYAENDDTIIIKINPQNFETLLREEPKIATMLLKELAQRLKKTNEFLC